MRLKINNWKIKSMVWLMAVCAVLLPGKAALAEEPENLVKLSREQMLNAKAEDYAEDAVLYWEEFQKNKLDGCDGHIPVSKLSDPVYCSMNLPSESMCDFTRKAKRDNGHLNAVVKSDAEARLLSWGGIYLTEGETLPEHFSVYLGTIKLFAYSKKQKCWRLIDDQPYPSGIALYELPWTTHKNKECGHVEYTDTYAKVDLTAEDLANNCLHFWGIPTRLDREDDLYYAEALTFWTDASVAGKLTATSGLDTKKSAGSNTVGELIFSRGIASSNDAKVVWGHTIPNAEYDKARGSYLNKLYGPVTKGIKEEESSENDPAGEDPSGGKTGQSGQQGAGDPAASSVSGNLIPEQAAGEKTPLTATKLKKPVVGKTGRSVKLKWQKVKGISGYEIQISTGKKFKKNVRSIEIKKAGKAQKKITLPGKSKKFYVRIRTFSKTDDGVKVSAWSKKKTIRLK
ncbi:MAG: hypothetical protein K5739_00200 [Lachnospiraceae bacterium]|nr:hypothetical protein [Lachnospiraceae bacterium]